MIDAIATQLSGNARDPERKDQTAFIKLTAPSAADAVEVHKLISQCKPLDLNSMYAYLLLCHHHADTCVVAHNGDELVGFVSGYVLPRDPQTFFVWQVAVHPGARGAKLGVRMLQHILGRQSTSSTRYVETTVSPLNVASRRMFQRFAETISASVSEQTLFDRTAFGPEDHEEEVLFRIGPFDKGSVNEEM